MPLGGGPGSQSESDAGSTTRGIHGGGGFGSNYGGFGVTGVAADFGSDPDGLSTNADVGLDYSGGGEGIRRDTAAGMFFGFPGSAFEAAREMAEFNTVPGGREYVSVFDPTWSGAEAYRPGSPANRTAQTLLQEGGRAAGGALGSLFQGGRPAGEFVGGLLGTIAGEYFFGEKPDNIGGPVPRSFGTFPLNSRGDDTRPEGGGPRSGTSGSNIIPASYDNRRAGLPPSTDSGERYIVGPTGRAQPLARVLQDLAHEVRSGGMPGATQRAIIDAMTPAQRRAAGIFLAPDGTVRPFREVFTVAVVNAANGRPLTTNQQAALGLAFNSIPSSGARRDAINALAGRSSGEVRDNLSAAVGQAMRAARDIAREARQQTAAQQAAAQAAALRAAGVRRPRQALARLEAAGIGQDAAAKLAALKAAGVTRPVSQVERLAAQGVRNPVQRLMAQAKRRDQAAATAAGTTVNKLRALRAAGVGQPAQEITRLKAAGVERPARKLAELRQAGVQRAAEKLVQLESAGVQRPARKIAVLRQAGIERGVQKVAQLKAAGVQRPAAKLTRLKQAGVKRPVQQLVQLKQAGVQRPAQKLRAQAARQPVSSAKPAAQRGALGKQTQRIIRTTDQSLTFKTASGKTRSAAQVAANAARNQASGRSLTPNQQRLLASAR